MKLTVSEAAALLHATEGVLHRWARDGVVPCQLVDGQYWFHRTDLLEWATANGVLVSTDAFPTSRRASDPSSPSLAAALKAGGVYRRVEGRDRDSVLAALVKRIPVQDEADRTFFLEVMRAREKLGSTGVGNGIAIPHARAPVVLAGQEPSITLCFLEQPVPFQAIDSKPVHTIFSLVTRTVRSHLGLLARLAAALHDPGFRDAVMARAETSVLFREAARVDANPRVDANLVARAAVSAPQ